MSENKVDRDIIDAWVDAAAQAGYRRTDDYNREDQEGVGFFQMTMKNGMRCSAAAAYLKPIRSRKNLHIITHAHTDKIEFDGKRATAVMARVRGKSQRIKARSRDILSAGSIGSPQILDVIGYWRPE